MTSSTGEIQNAVGPTRWPSPPVDLSISSLRELEACPRRWALGVAKYPEIWDRSGYPGKLNPLALRGTVVHLALEKVTKRLSEAGCPAVNDVSAIEVMKGLGGYTVLARSCIESALQRFESNPRAANVLEAARGRLEASIPEIRTRVQSQLSRLQLQPKETVADSRSRPEISIRRPLETGSYAEVTLRDPELGWFGIADLISLSEEHCEIRDFKTGQPSDDHAFQLRVYALLWWRDPERNPTRRRATKLVLTYGNKDVSVSVPEKPELESLARELATRGRAARASASVTPPEARPGPEKCRYCSVRHLCEAYWRPSTQRLLVAEADEQDVFGDAQVVVESRHGPRSWDAHVEVSKSVPAGEPLLLRTKVEAPGFGVGDRVRVLDVQFARPEVDDVGSKEPVVATMGAASEAFVVPGGG